MPELELPRLLVKSVVAISSGERLLLINRHPQPDERGVPIDSVIALELVDTGNAGVNRAATRVSVGGVVAFSGGASPEIAAGFRGPRAQITQKSDAIRVVLDPVEAFSSLARVVVSVDSATNDGHRIDASYSFMVEDRTAPRLVAVQAVSQTGVRLGFDEDVRVIDIAGIRLRPMDAPAVPLRVRDANAQGTMVTLTLNIEMTPDIRYEVVVDGVEDLFGNRALPPHHQAVFVGFRPTRPERRRFDLWSLLPKHNRRVDHTRDLWKLIACLQELTNLLLADIDRFPDIFDIEKAPVPFLELILADLGNPFRFHLNELDKRRLASVLVEMYRQKGTAPGIINAVRFFMGINILEIRSYSGDALVLGESELEVDWILGPSDRFALYAFDVVVGQVLTDRQRRQLRRVVEYLKPAHTHFVDLAEPSPPGSAEQWVLGIGRLGEGTELG